MSNPAHQWLVNRASPPGMLACGVRSPDGSFSCHSIEEAWPASKMEKILERFETVSAGLFAGQVSPRWTTWAFEQGQLRFVIRPDGWMLGLMVRSDSDALMRLDPLSTEFLSLKLNV